MNSPGAGTVPTFDGLEPLLVSGTDGPTKVAAAAFAFAYWVVVAYRNFRRHRRLLRLRRRAVALEEYRP